MLFFWPVSAPRQITRESCRLKSRLWSVAWKGRVGSGWALLYGNPIRGLTVRSAIYSGDRGSRWRLSEVVICQRGHPSDFVRSMSPKTKTTTHVMYVSRAHFLFVLRAHQQCSWITQSQCKLLRLKSLELRLWQKESCQLQCATRAKLPCKFHQPSYDYKMAQCSQFLYMV